MQTLPNLITGPAVWFVASFVLALSYMIFAVPAQASASRHSWLLPIARIVLAMLTALVIWSITDRLSFAAAIGAGFIIFSQLWPFGYGSATRLASTEPKSSITRRLANLFGCGAMLCFALGTTASVWQTFGVS